MVGTNGSGSRLRVQRESLEAYSIVCGVEWSVEVWRQRLKYRNSKFAVEL